MPCVPCFRGSCTKTSKRHIPPRKHVEHPPSWRFDMLSRCQTGFTISAHEPRKHGTHVNSSRSARPPAHKLTSLPDSFLCLPPSSPLNLSPTEEDDPRC